MFEITVKKRFNASHSIRLCDGSFKTPHIHNWLCEIFLSSEKLDECNCVIDFCLIDLTLTKVLHSLEGKKIHELDAFAGRSASAELIARYIFENTASELLENSALIAKVTVWEDEAHGASYLRPK